MEGEKAQVLVCSGGDGGRVRRGVWVEWETVSGGWFFFFFLLLFLVLLPFPFLLPSVPCQGLTCSLIQMKSLCKDGDKSVYIIFRVFNMFSDKVDVKLYVNPVELERKGMLSFSRRGRRSRPHLD